MPLHPPQASQARCNSSIALTGDGAPSRGLSDRRVVTARRMFTPHRATSSCVGRLVARIDARAKRTAGASDRSVGNGMTAGADMDRTVGCVGVRSGRGAVNVSTRFGDRANSAACRAMNFSSNARRSIAGIARPLNGRIQTAYNLDCQRPSVARASSRNVCMSAIAPVSGSVAEPAATLASATSCFPSRAQQSAFASLRSLDSTSASSAQINMTSALVRPETFAFMAALIGARRVDFYVAKVAPESATNRRSPVNFEEGEIVAPSVLKAGH